MHSNVTVHLTVTTEVTKRLDMLAAQPPSSLNVLKTIQVTYTYNHTCIQVVLWLISIKWKMVYFFYILLMVSFLIFFFYSPSDIFLYLSLYSYVFQLIAGKSLTSPIMVFCLLFLTLYQQTHWLFTLNYVKWSKTVCYQIFKKSIYYC